MAVNYRVQRTNLGGLTEDSTFNGRVVDIDDFLEMAPDYSGFVSKVISKHVIDVYHVTRQEGKMFSDILAQFFAEPYKKDKVLEGEI